MAARASGSCVSTSPLRSTVASGSASFGAMTPIPPVRMPGARSASKRCLPSMGHHPSSGSAMLVSRFFVPNAGMRPKPSAADLEARTSDRGAAFLSSGRYHHRLGINIRQSAGAGARDEAAMIRRIQRRLWREAAKQSRNTDDVIFLSSRKRPETNGCYHDILGQTRGFDHVGTDQLNLSPVLPVEFGCDAQASPRGLTGKVP